MGDPRACKIAAVRTGSMIDDNEALEDPQEWMMDRLPALKGILASLLGGSDLDQFLF